MADLDDKAKAERLAAMKKKARVWTSCDSLVISIKLTD